MLSAKGYHAFRPKFVNVLSKHKAGLWRRTCAFVLHVLPIATLCLLMHTSEEILISYLNYNRIYFKNLVHLGIWNCPYPSIEDFVRAPTDFSKRTRTFAYFGSLALRFTSNTDRTRKCHFIQLSWSCLNVWSYSYIWLFPLST